MFVGQIQGQLASGGLGVGVSSCPHLQSHCPPDWRIVWQLLPHHHVRVPRRVGGPGGHLQALPLVGAQVAQGLEMVAEAQEAARRARQGRL